MPSSCLLNEHTGRGVLAAAPVLWNFLMRHLFPGLPNCPAWFSLFGSFSSSRFYHALSILSFKVPHQLYITRTRLTCLRTGRPQFSPDFQSGRCCGTSTSPNPQDGVFCPELGCGTAVAVPPGPLRVTPCHRAEPFPLPSPPCASPATH